MGSTVQDIGMDFQGGGKGFGHGLVRGSCIIVGALARGVGVVEAGYGEDIRR